MKRGLERNKRGIGGSPFYRPPGNYPAPAATGGGFWRRIRGGMKYWLPLVIIIGVAFAIKVFTSGASGGGIDVGEELKKSQTIAEIWDKEPLGFLHYIFGGVPDFLIGQVGGTSGIVIVLAIFVMLYVSFSDILQNFSLFSKNIAWIIGLMLAIVAANLKLLMAIAIWSFSIVSGVGILAVGVGILFPFVFFILLHLWLGQSMWRIAMARNVAAINTASELGTAKAKAGMRAIKAMGDEVMSGEDTRP